MSLPVNRARAPMHTCERKLETEWGREGHRETRREKGVRYRLHLQPTRVGIPMQKEQRGGKRVEVGGGVKRRRVS